MPHLILVNEALKDYLVTASPAEKQRLREKLFFLADGYWEGGVRVKKLKGSQGSQGSRRKVVFEARLDRSRRLLFTLGRDRGESAVHVWGLVDHDDVGPAVRRIEAAAGAGRPVPSRILPANAPFLASDADETEERPDLSLEEPAEDWYTQEGLEDKAAADYGPQKWMVVGDEEWERLLRTSRPDSIEVHLRLTSAQESVLARQSAQRVDAYLCLRHDDYALAVRTSEQAGDLTAAGRCYVQTNKPERALACYERLGSDAGRARALEGMGRIDEALAIQKARHNQRDSERILRRMRSRRLRIEAPHGEGDVGQDET